MTGTTNYSYCPYCCNYTLDKEGNCHYIGCGIEDNSMDSWVEQAELGNAQDIEQYEIEDDPYEHWDSEMINRHTFGVEDEPVEGDYIDGEILNQSLGD